MNFEELFQSDGRPVAIAANQYVFRQGESDRSLYFVKTGLLKASYISKNGNEAVKSFLLPGNVIGSLRSARLNEGCSFGLMALQSSNLIRIAFDTLYQQSLENHEIAKWLNGILLALAIKKERREFELLCLSAEKRYQLLTKRSPELLEKVTQNDIARYLGITPVALSRIKKRLRR